MPIWMQQRMLPCIHTGSELPTRVEVGVLRTTVGGGTDEDSHPPCHPARPGGLRNVPGERCPASGTASRHRDGPGDQRDQRSRALRGAGFDPGERPRHADGQQRTLPHPECPRRPGNGPGRHDRIRGAGGSGHRCGRGNRARRLQPDRACDQPRRNRGDRIRGRDRPAQAGQLDLDGERRGGRSVGADHQRRSADPGTLGWRSDEPRLRDGRPGRNDNASAE